MYPSYVIIVLEVKIIFTHCLGKVKMQRLKSIWISILLFHILLFLIYFIYFNNIYCDGQKIAYLAGSLKKKQKKKKKCLRVIFSNVEEHSTIC